MNRDGIYVPSLFVNILKLCLILCNTIHCFIVNYKTILLIIGFFAIDFIIWNITKKSLYQAIKKAIKKAVYFIIYG